ncbi:MAG: glycerate kinase, partial [Sciscionella sp.]
MRVVIAPDKFAGTLSAVEAAQAVSAGWVAIDSDTETDLVPLSDGGPGFVDVLHAALGGRLLEAEVTGPLGDPVPATVLRIDDAAYVECAQACGLHLIPADRRDPAVTTS